MNSGGVEVCAIVPIDRDSHSILVLDTKNRQKPMVSSSFHEGIMNAELLTTEEAEPTEYVMPILDPELPLDNPDEPWLDMLAVSRR